MSSFYESPPESPSVSPSRKTDKIFYLFHFLVAEWLCIKAVVENASSLMHVSQLVLPFAYADTADHKVIPPVEVAVVLIFSVVLGIGMLACLGIWAMSQPPRSDNAFELFKMMVTTSFMLIAGVFGVSLLK